MRRPAQVYPWIMPLIDGPDTPSFPSSHSLQAHLISGALKLALPRPPEFSPCCRLAAAVPLLPGRRRRPRPRRPLTILADRVA